MNEQGQHQAAVALLVSNNRGNPNSTLFKAAIEYFVTKFTRKPDTHVALLVDGQVYESSLYSGVVSVPYAEWVAKQQNVSAVELHGIDADELKRRFSLIDGKGYDLSVIFGYILNLDWDDPRAFSCQEVVGHLLPEWVPDRVKVWRLAPTDFHLMALAYRHGYENGTRVPDTA